MRKSLYLPLAVLLAVLFSGCDQNPFLPDSSAPSVPAFNDYVLLGPILSFSAFSPDHDVEFFHIETSHLAGPVTVPRFFNPVESFSGSDSPVRLISADLQKFQDLEYWYEYETRSVKVYCEPERTNTLPGIPDGQPPALLDMTLAPGQSRSMLRVLVQAEDLGPGIMFTEWMSLFAVDKWGNVSAPAVRTVDLAYINVEVTSDMNPSVRLYGFYGKSLGGNWYEVLIYPDRQLQGYDLYTLGGTWTITQCTVDDLESPHRSVTAVRSGGVYSGTSIPEIAGFFLGGP
jgi:hypothetical protein